MTPIKTSNGNMCVGSVQFLLLVEKKLKKDYHYKYFKTVS